MAKFRFLLPGIFMLVVLHLVPTVGAANFVIAWGYNLSGSTDVPPGLANIQAIKAGSGFNLALLSNGTVVAWGYNDVGQTSVPAGLTNVAAISAGQDHCLALKTDGTVVAWGANNLGQSTIPAGLTN